jgi:quercetin dioxygenase-like cupin family protein
MEHPSAIDPKRWAVWKPEKMGKSTLFESERLMVGLNAFEPGQAHALHAHPGVDKLYAVLEGEGLLLLEGREEKLRVGQIAVAPAGVPHGVKNEGPARLLLLAVLAPTPAHR